MSFGKIQNSLQTFIKDPLKKIKKIQVQDFGENQTGEKFGYN